MLLKNPLSHAYRVVAPIATDPEIPEPARRHLLVALDQLAAEIALRTIERAELAEDDEPTTCGDDDPTWPGGPLGRGNT